MITITDSAAEHIKKQAKKTCRPPSVRLGLRGGGCTGYSYIFEWVEKAHKETDTVFKDKEVSVYVDPKSLIFLKGTELDFVVGIMGHGFKINNPNSTGSCGCGESIKF
jgi:iron-sulfur cluster assembly protein